MLVWESATGAYVPRHAVEASRVSGVAALPLRALDVGDVDGDGSGEVVVLLVNGELRIYDGWTGGLESLELTGLDGAVVLDVADVDPEPGDELVILSEAGVTVRRALVPAPLWTATGAGGTSLAIGNIDTDSAIEIVVATGAGSAGLVLDSGLRRTDWAYSPGFGDVVAVGDLDGDGIDDVLAADGDRVFAFDAVARAERWTVSDVSAGAFWIGDADGDGRREALVGSRWQYRIIALDGASGSEAWELRGTGGVVALDVGDVDGDCIGEIVWSAGQAIHVHDVETLAMEWSSIAEDWPSFAIGDLDGDLHTEVVWLARLRNSWQSRRLHVDDPSRRRSEYVSSHDTYTQQLPLALAQLDADPQLEYLMAGEGPAEEKLEAYDGIRHDIEWGSVVFPSQAVEAIAVSDVNRDGTSEVLVGTSDHLWVLQGSDGAPLWRTPAPAGYSVRGIRAVDVDGDGGVEIVYIRAFNGGLFVLDGTTYTEEWSWPVTGLSCLDVDDIDGDADLDIVLGDYGGRLLAFDGATNDPVFDESLEGNFGILAFDVVDLDGDAAPEIATVRETTSSTTAQVQVRQASDRALLWQGPELDGWGDGGLEVADVDDDGLLEIAVATRNLVRFFEYGRPVPDAISPTFDGAPGLQSAAPLASPSCCPAVDLAWNTAADDRSPPVEFRVYRGTTPGFTPSPANLVARTGLTSYRDAGLAAGVDHYYVVRAADTAGNEDSNLVERSARTTVDTLPPAQGNVLRSRRLGADVSLEFPGAPAEAWRINRDTAKDAVGTTVLIAETRATSHVDAGGAAAAATYFYYLRGLSACSRTPGP